MKNPALQRPAEKLTDSKVDFSFRIYWTKMARHWSAERRAEVRGQVLLITQAADFSQNLIEKWYSLPLDEVAEKTHSGASLIALLEVLAALDSLEESEQSS